MQLARKLRAFRRNMRRFYALAQKLWFNEPFRWALTLAFAAFMGVAAGKTVLGFSGSVSVVDGASMEPTYQPGARVFSGPISTPLHRGDIVLVNDGSRDYALKRIVGLPGETVYLWRGYTFINRRMLREPYLARFTYTFPDEHFHRFVFVLGPDEYFVMGDNRTCSVDSRTYGPVERKHIKSRVPSPGSAPRATLAAFTLPAPGSRTIRPL